MDNAYVIGQLRALRMDVRALIHYLVALVDNDFEKAKIIIQDYDARCESAKKKEDRQVGKIGENKKNHASRVILFVFFIVYNRLKETF